MRVDTALLVPGQGAYTPGMFADRADPDLTDLLRVTDQVAAELGRPPVSPLLLRPDGPSAEQLRGDDPFALQLAVFAAGLGGLTLHRDTSPAVLVGHSMGEIAVLVAAGAFDPADGARLVGRRALALAERTRRPGGMLGVGLSAERAEGLLRAIDEPGLALAARNAPRQVAVSGPEPALVVVTAAARALGVPATRLTSPYAFHSPELGPAAEAFAASVDGIRQRPLRARVWSPTAGRELTDDDDLLVLLVRQLTAPVDFLGAVRNLHAAGVDSFVEVCDGGLAGLVARTVPAARPAPDRSVDEPTAAESPVGVAVEAPDGDDSIVDQLRQLYATGLGYPEEAVTAEADLEADLGIDSLKRAEMLVKVVDRFGLEGSTWQSELEKHTSIADLADLVETVRAGSR